MLRLQAGELGFPAEVSFRDVAAEIEEEGARNVGVDTEALQSLGKMTNDVVSPAAIGRTRVGYRRHHGANSRGEQGVIEGAGMRGVEAVVVVNGARSVHRSIISTDRKRQPAFAHGAVLRDA